MKEKVRMLMILNEIEVDIARIVRLDDQYNNLSAKIGEVKSIVLENMFPAMIQGPEIDWQKIKDLSC